MVSTTVSFLRMLESSAHVRENDDVIIYFCGWVGPGGLVTC